MISSYILLILVMVVIIINGATDAPNAVATIVTTTKIKIKYALIVAAICNFLGVLIMSLLSPKIVNIIYNIADFSFSNNAYFAVLSSMITIIIWGIVTWYFGIPTSESHALVASLTGAAIASSINVNLDMWNKVLLGIIYSTILGVIVGMIVSRFILWFNIKQIKILQYLSGCVMAFIHGAQDGLKFLGVLILVHEISFGKIFNIIPVWIIIICSCLMLVGTIIGGKRIIEKVGNNLVKLDELEGMASDVAAIVSLFVGTILGIPISTTQMKTATILGAVKDKKRINKKVFLQFIFSWILTFPVCILMGYLITKLFL